MANDQETDAPPRCKHGDRLRKGGVSGKGRAWLAYMCPKRSCDPEWAQITEAIDLWVNADGPEAAQAAKPADDDKPPF